MWIGEKRDEKNTSMYAHQITVVNAPKLLTLVCLLLGFIESRVLCSSERMNEREEETTGSKHCSSCAWSMFTFDDRRVLRERAIKKNNNIDMEQKWIINTASRLYFHCEFIHLARKESWARLSEVERSVFWRGIKSITRREKLTCFVFYRSVTIDTSSLNDRLIKMKSLVIVFIICLSSSAYGDDKKPAKAIAVLGFSDKVFGSMSKDNLLNLELTLKLVSLICPFSVSSFSPSPSTCATASTAADVALYIDSRYNLLPTVMHRSRFHSNWNCWVDTRSPWLSRPWEVSFYSCCVVVVGICCYNDSTARREKLLWYFHLLSLPFLCNFL